MPLHREKFVVATTCDSSPIHNHAIDTSSVCLVLHFPESVHTTESLVNAWAVAFWETKRLACVMTTSSMSQWKLIVRDKLFTVDIWTFSLWMFWKIKDERSNNNTLNFFELFRRLADCWMDLITKIIFSSARTKS